MLSIMNHSDIDDGSSPRLSQEEICDTLQAASETEMGDFRDSSSGEGIDFLDNGDDEIRVSTGLTSGEMEAMEEGVGGSVSEPVKEDRVVDRGSLRNEIWEGTVSSEGNGISEDDRWVDRVSERSWLSEAEAAADQGLMVGVTGIGDQRAEPRFTGWVREVPVEAGMERELATYDCDSPSLASSELSGDLGNWMNGFEPGDMVWGKVKSHPWWPGHIFNEAFASPSVRRMKRGGHVLVAFFGDSSYGWFDPAELIPFDPYYAEKSKQTTSRNFVKALEEAIDEASRRCALGLSCRCRNTLNFRDTSVAGYVAVDVVNYEFGGVYSMKQIKKARDGLVPVDVISFVKQLAVTPRDAERGTIAWVNNIAMLLALRKTTFEEFDETYAQAFGVDPIRPSRDPLAVLEQPLSLAARAAHLSGPLVFAEALGVKRKTSGKSVVKSSKEKSNKDKYLFKRRDDVPRSTTPAEQAPSPSDHGPPAFGVRGAKPTYHLQTQGNPFGYLECVPKSVAGSVISSVTAGGVTPVDEYVLQRRAPADGGMGSAEDGFVKIERAMEVETSARMPLMSEDVKADVPAFGDTNRIYVQQEPRPEFDLGGAAGVFEQKPGLMVSAVDLASAGRILVKKEKKRQRREDGGLEISDAGEKKKKRKKKEAGDLVNPDHLAQNVPKFERESELFQTSAGSTMAIAVPTSICPEMRKNEQPGAGRPVGTSDFAIALPAFDFNPQDLDVPMLTSDLLALALNPYYGCDRNASILVRHVFLRFRSLVYQKSLGSPPAMELATLHTPARKSELIGAQLPSEEASDGEAREITPPLHISSKQLKKVSRTIFRPDDPTKSGRKRALSDRQEERPVKKVKKLSQLQALASEKKARSVKKLLEGHARVEPKSATTTSTPAKVSRKQDLTPSLKKQQTVPHIKKQEPLPAPKISSPTFLVMKFPPRSTLPSIASMKARLGRFGPIEPSSARVYWGSYTCKVLFKYRSDAQAAYMYARENHVFGPIKVNYSLRDADTSDSIKKDAEDAVQSKLGRGDNVASDPRPSVKNERQPIQLKSCLKKTSVDDVGPAGGNIMKETPRVKFMLEGEDAKPEPLMVANEIGNDVGNSASLLPPLNLNGKNLRSVNFQLSQSPISLPIPTSNIMHPTLLTPHSTEMQPPPPLYQRPPLEQPHFSKTQHHLAAEHTEGRERHSVNIDVSHEMLNLLRKCSDIVSNVRVAFGYVPYHAL